MSYQDGRRVEALEAAVRELREMVKRNPDEALVASIEAQRQLALRVEQLERVVSTLQAKLTERPALARRHA